MVRRLALLAAAVLLPACGGASGKVTEVRADQGVVVLQGTVAGVQPAAARFDVQVQLAGTPTPHAASGTARVAIDSGTQFQPDDGGLAGLHPGDDVLVRAASGNGPARALTVSRIDTD